MTRFTAVVLACAAICALCTGCDEETSGGTMVPAVPLGLIIATDQSPAQPEGGRAVTAEEYSLIMLWGNGNVGADLFNVYRRTGDGAYEKLNAEIVRRGPFLQIPYAPIGLGFVDGTFDKASTATYSYYVVAANSHGEESGPSETVTLVPADYDPEAIVTGLTPTANFSADLVPTFSWDPVQGAASYCVVLEEITQDRGTLPIWIHRTSETSASLTSKGGVTYLDGIGRTLESDASYYWGVFAVNANNSGFAANFVYLATDRYVTTVVDAQQSRGHKTVFWNQMDYTGTQVPEGGYELRFATASYDTTLNFEIMPELSMAGSGARRVVAQTSDGTFVEMTTYTPVLGAPVEIHYYLPAETPVRMQIYAEAR
jgi:hypothetical protein